MTGDVDGTLDRGHDAVGERVGELGQGRGAEVFQPPLLAGKRLEISLRMKALISSSTGAGSELRRCRCVMCPHRPPVSICDVPGLLRTKEVPCGLSFKICKCKLAHIGLRPDLHDYLVQVIAEGLVERGPSPQAPPGPPWMGVLSS